MENGCFDPTESVQLSEVLYRSRQTNGPGVVALDIGANIGVHTLQWARLMRSWGSVIAIEAQERLFYALAGNIALNNCANVRAIWGAMSDHCGEMEIAEPDYWQPASFGSLELKNTPKTEYIGQCIDYEDPNLTVKTLTIDSLNLSRVDLIKMDIEGMEIEALKGATETIERCKPVMFVEILKSNPAEVRGFLESYGYTGFNQIGQNLLAV